MKNESLGYFQIIIAALLFGLIPIAVRFGENLGAYNLSFFRVFVAALCLGTFFLFSKKNLTPFKYNKGKLIFFGAIHGFIILGYFLAIQFLSIASAVLLLYSSSIWMIIFSYFILKEKISLGTWVALIIAFVGVIFVLSPQDFFMAESLIGSLAGLFAGMGMGLVYILSKTFTKYDKVSLTFWQNLIALPFLLPLLLVDIPSFTQLDILIAILLGSLFTVVPFILLFKGLEKVSGQKGGIVILLDMIFPILFGLVIFREIPSISVIVGGVLIIFGTLIITLRRAKEK